MFFWSQIYVLWCETLCSLANPARLFSPVHIYVRGHFFLWATLMSWKIMFGLCLGTFASLTLPSKTATLWLFCLCSLANPARLFSTDHICARGHIFFVGHPYELCLTNIFDLFLGTFASLTLPFKTASLWLFCLCSLANPARLFSPDHILARGHFFFVCDPNTGTFENWLSTVKALRPHSARYARFVGFAGMSQDISLQPIEGI